MYNAFIGNLKQGHSKNVAKKLADVLRFLAISNG